MLPFDGDGAAVVRPSTAAAAQVAQGQAGLWSLEGTRRGVEVVLEKQNDEVSF